MAWLAGVAWWAIILLIGTTVVADIRKRLPLPLIVAPAAGIVVLVALFSLLLIVRQISWAPLASCIVLAICLLRARQTIAFSRSASVAEWRAVALSFTFGLLEILAASLSRVNEPDLFWAIYKVTLITPGDSPIALEQAQYLVHAGQVINKLDFALFDRTFLGGILSAGALCAFGLCPGETLYSATAEQQQAYVSLWIMLNSLGILGIWLAVSEIVKKRALIVTALIAATPFVVFNTMGLWPKFLGLYFCAVGLWLALRRRPMLAVLATGMAFFCHGLFLWPHLGLAFLTALYLLGQRQAKTAVMVLATALAVPVAWFGAQFETHSLSPLNFYYLYNTDVSTALHQPLQSIAQEFYATTSLGKLAMLPLFNAIRLFLPGDLIGAISSFQLRGNWPNFFRSWYWAEFTCAPLFAGLVLGFLAISGLLASWSRDIRIAAAVLLCILMPLVPAAAIYRHDRVVVTVIEFQVIIPFSMGIAWMIGRFSKAGLVVTAILVALESIAIYVIRANNFIYLLPITVIVGIAVLLAVIRPATRERPVPVWGSEHWRIGIAALSGLSIVALPIVALGVLFVLRDGGLTTLLAKPWF